MTGYSDFSEPTWTCKVVVRLTKHSYMPCVLGQKQTWSFAMAVQDIQTVKIKPT